MKLNDNRLQFSSYSEVCRAKRALREVADIELDDVSVANPNETCFWTGEPLPAVLPNFEQLVLDSLHYFAHERRGTARLSLVRHAVRSMLKEFETDVKHQLPWY